jgi:hypothetical protein
MWDDPSAQVRFVCVFGGIASPAIVLSQFALNKVIARFRNTLSVEDIYGAYSH